MKDKEEMATEYNDKMLKLAAYPTTREVFIAGFDACEKKMLADASEVIGELERQNEALMVMQIEDDTEIKQLRSDLKWVIDMATLGQRRDEKCSASEFLEKTTAIITKHNLDKEGV